MEKIKNKKGCLYAFLIGCAIFIGGMIFLIVTVNNALKVFDLSVQEFQAQMKILNREVNESTLAPNPISAENYQSFKDKANAAGFSIFDDNGNVNLNLVTININEPLTLTGDELGAMLNNGFSNGSEYGFLKVLKFNISSGSYTVINTVLKLDFTKVKEAIGQLGGDLPNSIYLTCESVATGSTGSNLSSRLILTDSTLKINELTDEENEKLIKLLNKMTEDKQGNLNFENLSDKIISDSITKVAQAANCYITFNGSNITFTKF